MKTASVNVRIQENIKEQAEVILSKIGLPRAVTIDLFYRQIIMNNGLPFLLTVPRELPIRDTMTDVEFNQMLLAGMEQVNEEGQSQPVESVFDELLQGL